jgi:hypothetical protein
MHRENRRRPVANWEVKKIGVQEYRMRSPVYVSRKSPLKNFHMALSVARQRSGSVPKSPPRYLSARSTRTTTVRLTRNRLCCRIRY